MKRSNAVLITLAALWAHAGAQSFTTIYTFPSMSIGFQPTGVPYIGAGGILFGTTSNGGTASCATPTGCGTVFSLTPPSQPGSPWVQSLLYSFKGAPDGAQPLAGVLSGTNGTLLATTGEGGPANSHCHSGCGALAQLTPPLQPGGFWAETILYDFVKTDYFPTGITTGSASILYGVARAGGNSSCDLGCGSIYELFPPAETGDPWTRTAIHQFATSTGGYPNSPLVRGTSGVLYGSTTQGGNRSRTNCTNGCGTVFSLTPPTPPATAWTFQDIYRFAVSGADGIAPGTGLLLAPDGVLYGTTRNGGGTGCAGGLGCGTVFSLAPPTTLGTSQWTETIIYSFEGGMDGEYPNSATAGLAIGAGGILYGVTEQGGGTGCNGQGCGTLFQLTPPAVAGGKWIETILHTFTGGADGEIPTYGPSIDAKGVLYGFAYGGTGTSCLGGGCGVVYQYIP